MVDLLIGTAVMYQRNRVQLGNHPNSCLDRVCRLLPTWINSSAPLLDLVDSCRLFLPKA